MFELNIRQCENGYILWRPSDTEQDTDDIIVVESEDDDNEAMVKVLYKIAELLGYQYDKYSSENLNIDFSKKGHKLE